MGPDAVVSEGLDRDIIRRIVSAHINEVAACYNDGLTRDPDLRGRISVEFIIGVDGTVDKSEVKESTLADAAVGTCVITAMKRWKFPRPAGGNSVSVLYPFVFEPS
jgi:TonB family protein